MTRTVVIVPTYNEIDNIGQLVEAVFAVDAGCDVLVVDDNSPDGTGRLVDEIRANEPRLHVLHRPQRLGLGSAYVDGFRHALDQGYGHLFSMDADLSHDPRYLPEFLASAGRFEVVV